MESKARRYVEARPAAYVQARPAAKLWPAAVSALQFVERMLKLIGSYALARLLGFGIVGAIVIYMLLSLFT